MKKCVVISALLLLASLPGYSAPKAGSNTQPSRFSQFRMNRSPKAHGLAKAVAHPHGIPVTQRAIQQTSAPWKRTAEDVARPASYAGRAHKYGSSAPAVSFVTAARTALGGSDDDSTEAVMGDFNGDGKPDVAKIVTNVISTVATYQISVMLGNGDGTFKTAVLTATDGNTDGPIMAGDLTGSGTDDIIQVHPTGDNCGAPRPNTIRPQPMTLPSCGSSIDVMLSNGSGGFAAPVNYPVSDASLVGGLLTDVNGDGQLDLLAFDDASPADVIVMLGKGDGTFEAPSSPGKLTTSAPRNMIFADFNGDGDIDFAGQAESGQIQVTLASGAGLFANAPVALTTQDGEYDACNSITGELTSAKVPEIVSFNCEQNTVTVYVNSGEGTFATGLYYNNNGDQDQDIGDGAIADMNGDGKNDIVAINEDTAEISVFLGNGDGTVAVQPLRYGVGGYAWTAPLVADFNGDGLADVVVSDDLYNLAYLQGYGEGTFKAAPTYSLPNSFNQDGYTYSVVSGDFNGDGIPDVAVGQDDNYGSTGVTIYLGKGDGTFLTGVSYGPSSDMGELAVADFNGDGILDIAAIDWNTQRVQIFLGNGDGTFTVGALLPADTNNEPGPSGLVVGDFNKDGKPDIAVSNYDGNVGVLLGNGNGTFASVVSYPAGEGLGADAIAAADVNGDGFLDLEVACGSDDQPAVVIMLGKSDSSGTFEAPTAIDLHGEPNYIAVGDLRNDGKLDLAVTESDGATYNGQIEVFLGSGTGTFATPVTYAASTFGAASTRIDPANIQMADLAGSGNLGLVYLNSDFGTLAVATGNGDGTLNAPVEFPTTEDVWGMALVDLTGDGFTDVLAGEDDGGGFSVLVNGNGSAANPNYSLGTQTPGASVTAGSSATYTIDLSGTNGYTGTVTFTCGNLPAGATCAFSPSSVVANGSLPLTTTLTVSTTASSSAELLIPARPGSKSSPTLLLASLSGIGLFGMVLAGSGKKRNVRILTGMMVLLLFGTLAACSGTSSGGKATTGTPAGTYVVAVTSTGTGTGAPSHTLNLSLVVK
jgi:FG-GAP-like repeat/FG-GAP repeat